MNLMESAPNCKKISKKRKRRKTPKPSGSNATIVKPECFDGMSNWLNFKKTLETKKERVPENSKRFNAKSLKRPFKRYRPFQVKSKMPIDEQQKNTSSQFNSSEKDDSGWISGSDLSPGPSSVKSKQNFTSPQSSQNSTLNEDTLKVLTNALSIDCEMVGTGPDGKDSMLARVSIVNTYGQCVYDEFVKPKERVTDFRTHVSGVRPSDLKKGKELFDIQKDVSELIEGRKVVGHDLKHDFDVLFISHPRSLIRDTSKYKPFREICGGRTPSLKKLTSVILGCNIQGAEHNSIEDAQAAMLLYLRHKKEWERQIKASRKKKPT